MPDRYVNRGGMWVKIPDDKKKVIPRPARGGVSAYSGVPAPRRVTVRRPVAAPTGEHGGGQGRIDQPKVNRQIENDARDYAEKRAAQRYAQQRAQSRARAQAQVRLEQTARGQNLPPTMAPRGERASQVGRIAPGNIDLTHRPPVYNKDGSISTVRSITIEQDGRQILIPTVVNGRVVSNAAAKAHYRKTGEHLGIFQDDASAERYAEALHRQQAAQYAPQAPVSERGQYPGGPDTRQEDVRRGIPTDFANAPVGLSPQDIEFFKKHHPKMALDVARWANLALNDPVGGTLDLIRHPHAHLLPQPLHGEWSSEDPRGHLRSFELGAGPMLPMEDQPVVGGVVPWGPVGGLHAPGGFFRPVAEGVRAVRRGVSVYREQGIIRRAVEVVRATAPDAAEADRLEGVIRAAAAEAKAKRKAGGRYKRTIYSPGRIALAKSMEDAPHITPDHADGVLAVGDAAAQAVARARGWTLEQTWDAFLHDARFKDIDPRTNDFKDFVQAQSEFVAEGAQPEAHNLEKVPETWADADPAAVGQEADALSAEYPEPVVYGPKGKKIDVLPPGTETPEGMRGLISKLHARAVEAAEYRRWYAEAARRILQHVGGDVDKAERLADIIAIFSPQAKVYSRMNDWNNLDRAIRAWDHMEAGGTLAQGDYMAMGQSQANKAMDAFHGRHEWGPINYAKAPKTSRFSRNFLYYINEPKYKRIYGDRQFGTMDLWMNVVFGWPGEKPLGGPTYAFMEDATAAVAKMLGWRVDEAQAAIWVSIKAEVEKTSLGEAGISYAQALEHRGHKAAIKGRVGLPGEKYNDLIKRVFKSVMGRGGKSMTEAHRAFEAHMTAWVKAHPEAGDLTGLGNYVEDVKAAVAEVAKLPEEVADGVRVMMAEGRFGSASRALRGHTDAQSAVTKLMNNKSEVFLQTGDDFFANDWATLHDTAVEAATDLRGHSPTLSETVVKALNDRKFGLAEQILSTPPDPAYQEALDAVRALAAADKRVNEARRGMAPTLGDIRGLPEVEEPTRLNPQHIVPYEFAPEFHPPPEVSDISRPGIGIPRHSLEGKDLSGPKIMEHLYGGKGAPESLNQAERGKRINAMIQAGETGNVITFFQNANVSSAIHELAHAIEPFLSVEDRVALARLGVGDPESFARTVERYFAAGIAPTPELASAYENLAVGMLDVYGHAEMIPGGKFNPEIRAVFDRFIVGQEKVNPQFAARLKVLPRALAQTDQPPDDLGDFAKRWADEVGKAAQDESSRVAGMGHLYGEGDIVSNGKGREWRILGRKDMNASRRYIEGRRAQRQGKEPPHYPNDPGYRVEVTKGLHPDEVGMQYDVPESSIKHVPDELPPHWFQTEEPPPKKPIRDMPEEDLHAEMERIDKIWDSLVEKRVGKGHDPREQARRNLQAARRRRRGLSPLPTVKEEMRQRAAAELRDFMERHADDPSVQKAQAMLERHGEIQDELARREQEAGGIFVEPPPPEWATPAEVEKHVAAVPLPYVEPPPDVTEAAQALADRHGIDIADVTGSGEDGRILKVDVEGARIRGMGARERIQKEIRAGKIGEGKQKVIYSEARAERAAEVQRIRNDPSLSPEVKQRLAGQAMRGELPKVVLNGMTRNLDADVLAEMKQIVDDFPHLQPFQWKRAMDALDKFVRGENPQRNELVLLEHIFGKDTARSMEEVRSRLRHISYELINLPRSIMASFDLSAPFRQGLVAMARHPIISGKNFPMMVDAFFREGAYADSMSAIHNDPMYSMAVTGKNPLAITDLESMDTREDMFLSSLAEELTGKTYLRKVGGGPVRMSSRAYTSYLAKTRFDVFKHHVRVAGNHGVNVHEEKFLDDLNRFINSATGRGSFNETAMRAQPVLNALLFSPRLLASRINFLNPWWYKSLHPYARKQALRSMIQLATATGAVLSLVTLAGKKDKLPVSVIWNPLNADFAKLKMGNTRMDIMGGFQQELRVVSQLIAGRVISSTTGKKMLLGAGRQSTSEWDILERYFRGKTAPVPSIVVDMLKREDFQGHKLNYRDAKSWQREFKSHMVPLLWGDAKDIYKEHHGGMNGIEWAAAGYGTGMWGLGLQTYGPRDTSAESLSKLEKEAKLAGDPPPTDKMLKSAKLEHQMAGISSQNPVDWSKGTEDATKQMKQKQEALLQLYEDEVGHSYKGLQGAEKVEDYKWNIRQVKSDLRYDAPDTDYDSLHFLYQDIDWWKAHQ